MIFLMYHVVNSLPADVIWSLDLSVGLSHPSAAPALLPWARSQCRPQPETGHSRSSIPTHFETQTNCLFLFTTDFLQGESFLTSREAIALLEQRSSNEAIILQVVGNSNGR